MNVDGVSRMRAARDYAAWKSYLQGISFGHVLKPGPCCPWLVGANNRAPEAKMDVKCRLRSQLQNSHLGLIVLLLFLGTGRFVHGSNYTFLYWPAEGTFQKLEFWGSFNCTGNWLFRSGRVHMLFGWSSLWRLACRGFRKVRFRKLFMHGPSLQLVLKILFESLKFVEEALQKLWEAWQDTPNLSSNLAGWGSSKNQLCEYLDPNANATISPGWQGVQCSNYCNNTNDNCTVRQAYIIGL